MYRTQNYIQIERQLDPQEGEVGTDRYIQHRSIDRWRDSLQHRTIDRDIVRQRGGGGRYRQMYTTSNNRQIVRLFIAQNNRQIERYLDREEGKEATDRCTRHRTIDRQRDSQIERRRRQVQINVYNKKQQIDREIVKQRGGGGSYRKLYTKQNNRQIERQFIALDNRQIERQLDREEKEEATD